MNQDKLFKLTQHLRHIAILYKLNNKNIFSSRAFNRAANSLERLGLELADLPSKKTLLSIAYIGESIASEILSFLDNPKTELLKNLEESLSPKIIELAKNNLNLINPLATLYNYCHNNQALWLDRLSINYFSLFNLMTKNEEELILNLLKPSLNKQFYLPDSFNGLAIEGPYLDKLPRLDFLFHTHSLGTYMSGINIEINLPQALLSKQQALNYIENTPLLPLHFLLGIYSDYETWQNVFQYCLKKAKKPLLIYYPISSEFLSFTKTLKIRAEDLFLPAIRQNSEASLVDLHLASINKNSLLLNANANGLLRFLYQS